MLRRLSVCCNSHASFSSSLSLSLSCVWISYVGPTVLLMWVDPTVSFYVGHWVPYVGVSCVHPGLDALVL